MRKTCILVLIIVIQSIEDIAYCAKQLKIQNKIFHDITDPRFYLSHEKYNIFEEYITKYEKKYANKQEYNFRYKIFTKNLDKINKLNNENNLTVFGINQFTDRTHEDMAGKCMKLNNDRIPSLKYVKYKPRGVTPKQIDYRKEGYVTEVKDQKDCGSCYVFSAIGNIEGQYAKKHQKLISLSEQQGLDCDDISAGCDGGYMDDTIGQLIGIGGCWTEKDYPYKEEKGKCRTDPHKIVARVTNGSILVIPNLDILKNALANIGPLSIGIETCDEFSLYESGIFDKRCRGKLDHGVVLVGYGSEGVLDYWIIKNSWGPHWGEQGYIRVQIREDNICGLGQYVVTAEVD